MRSHILRAIWERSCALFWAKAIFGNKKYKPNQKTNVNLSNIEKLLSNEKNNNDDNENNNSYNLNIQYNSNKIKNNYDGCKITLADNSVDNSVYPLNKKLLSLELVGFYESFSVTLVM